MGYAPPVLAAAAAGQAAASTASAAASVWPPPLAPHRVAAGDYELLQAFPADARGVFEGLEF